MKFDKVMLATAKLWSEESCCERRKVGAVLAKDGRVLVTGYNGTVSGTANDCEYDCSDCGGLGDINTFVCTTCDGAGIITNDLTVHAEQNVIAFASRRGISTDGCTLYITLSPCKQCSKLLAQAGIKRVVYSELYKDTAGVGLLSSIGIECKHITI